MNIVNNKLFLNSINKKLLLLLKTNRKFFNSIRLELGLPYLENLNKN